MTQHQDIKSSFVSLVGIGRVSALHMASASAAPAPPPSTLLPVADERWQAKYIQDYEGGLYIAYNGHHHEEPQSAVTVSEVPPPSFLPHSVICTPRTALALRSGSSEDGKPSHHRCVRERSPFRPSSAEDLLRRKGRCSVWCWAFTLSSPDGTAPHTPPAHPCSMHTLFEFSCSGNLQAGA